MSKRNIYEIKGFTPPKLYTGKEWFIGFNAFDPALGSMHRKKIKLNHINKVTDRRRYATDLIGKLFTELQKGWNPWIEKESAKAYTTFREACNHYRRFLDKMFADGNYRDETYTGYVSYLKNIEGWNNARKVPITYVYQFDRQFITDFLDYIYIDKGNAAITRDNYLGFFRVLSGHFLQHQFVKVKPSDGILSLGKHSKKKQRTIISDVDMIRLYDHLSATNKYFLLACYILHYCFIRPKEMSQLRLSNFSIQRQTVFIPDTVSKNKKDGTVTVPAKVFNLMIDLKIFESPGDYYLFSAEMKPGKEFRDEKQFRNKWLKLRKILTFPDTYKFYSLKDTGITSMLREYDSLTVRDQARHGSILMTDTYTPHDIVLANHLLLNHKGIF